MDSNNYNYNNNQQFNKNYYDMSAKNQEDFNYYYGGFENNSYNNGNYEQYFQSQNTLNGFTSAHSQNVTSLQNLNENEVENSKSRFLSKEFNEFNQPIDKKNNSFQFIGSFDFSNKDEQQFSMNKTSALDIQNYQNNQISSMSEGVNHNTTNNSNQLIMSSTAKNNTNNTETSEQKSQDQPKKIIIDGKIWQLANDQELLKYAAQCRCDWKKIHKKFNKTYTPYFLKMRYKEITQNRVHRKTKFTHKEDLIIAKYFDKLGSDWKKIASFLKDRTGVMVKNRYYSYIRKREQLNTLISEVKNIEAQKCLVDDLESTNEEYAYSVSDEQIHNASENDGASDEVISHHSQQQSQKDDIQAINFSAYPQQCQQQQSNQYGYNSAAPSMMIHQENTEQIDMLRNRVKSLEYIISQNQKELSLLKMQHTTQQAPHIPNNYTSISHNETQ